MKNNLYQPDALSITKRKIKHPAMIKKYTKPNYACTTDKPLNFIGIDFETEPSTGEIMLLGIWYNDKYYHYFKDDHKILDVLCRWIKIAIDNKYTLVHWSKFDQNAIIKLFLLELNEEQRKNALDRQGKFSISYDKEGWTAPPLCIYHTALRNRYYEFGITSVMTQKTINVYMQHENATRPMFTSIIDLNTIYKNNLVKATKNQKLNFYDKLDEGFMYNGKKYSYHVIDWNLFRINEDYRKGVLKSNELDARAVKELGDKFINNFHRVWNKYPKNIFSSGTLAKMVLACELDENDFNSINFQKQLENWNYEETQSNKELCDKLHIMACEAYSGGIFELYNIGMGDAWVADISACYPNAIDKLPDLRDSVIIEGKGTPPKPKENEIIFVRGTVKMPKKAIHTMNIHNPDYPETVCRPYGTFKTTYLYEEREFAKQQNAKFSNEEYIIIKTKGVKSPLAISSSKLFETRKELNDKKDVAQQIVKDANNSCYGITIEGTPIFKEIYNLDGTSKIIFDGFKAGAMYNPILASLITAYCRIVLCTAMLKIRENGGILIQANTDSIHWKGDKENLPEKFDTLLGPCGWAKEKKMGFFEEPVLIKDFISLATGRYGGYDTNKDKYITKLRSYIITDKDKHYLKELLDNYKDLEHCTEIPLASKIMITSKLTNNRINLDVIDICRIDTIVKDLKIISQNTKCISPLATLDNPIPNILNGYTPTEPHNTDYFIKGINVEMDLIRERTLKLSKNIPIPKIKKQIKTRKRVQKYRANLSEEKKKEIREKDRLYRRRLNDKRKDN